MSLSSAACSSSSTSSAGWSGSDAVASQRQTEREAGQLASGPNGMITQDEVNKIKGYSTSAMSDLDTIVN
jgi:hypothetical protein